MPSAGAFGDGLIETRSLGTQPDFRAKLVRLWSGELLGHFFR